MAINSWNVVEVIGDPKSSTVLRPHTLFSIFSDQNIQRSDVDYATILDWKDKTITTESCEDRFKQVQYTSIRWIWRSFGWLIDWLCFHFAAISLIWQWQSFVRCGRFIRADERAAKQLIDLDCFLHLTLYLYPFSMAVVSLFPKLDRIRISDSLTETRICPILWCIDWSHCTTNIKYDTSSTPLDASRLGSASDSTANQSRYRQ